MRLRLAALALLFALPGLAVRPAAAQQLEPRFGFGFNAMASTEDGLGFGFRGRASAPVNSDLSFAIDLGFTGFILEGRDKGVYVFDPQLSAIVTFPGTERAPYFMGGVGAYLPVSNEEFSDSGPTLHLGIGWVRGLTETTIFYEINPALAVGRDAVEILLPFRVGVIF